MRSMSSIVMQKILVLFSGMTVGTGLLLAWRDLRLFFVERDRLWLVKACSRIGPVILVYLVLTEILLRVPAIPATWQAWLYAIGLLLSTVGFVGVWWSLRHRKRQ